MKLNTLKKRLSGAAMSVLALGILFISSAAAQAQYRDYDYRDDRRHDDHHDHRSNWSRERTREYAYAFGYFVAYPEGRESYRDRRIDYNDVRLYRNDTNGFLSWMGDRDTYRSYYRRGFELGFRDGRDGRNRRFGRQEVERILGASLRDVYGRNDWRDDRRYDDYDRGRYDRNEIIRIAQQNGYRDGQHHGEVDRRARRGHDYNSSEFRNGLRGFRSEYRDRELYRRAYQNAYRQGYEQGYRRGGWGWR